MRPPPPSALTKRELPAGFTGQFRNSRSTDLSLLMPSMESGPDGQAISGRNGGQSRLRK